MRLDRPSRIVVADDRTGLVSYLCSLRRELSMPDCEIIHVRPHHATRDAEFGVTRIIGAVTNSAVQDQVRDRLGEGAW